MDFLSSLVALATATIATIVVGALWVRHQRTRDARLRQADLQTLFRQLNIEGSPPEITRYSARPEFLQELTALIRYSSPQTIVDIGSGLTTVVAAAMCRNLEQGHVIAFEHSSAIALQTRAMLARYRLSAFARVVHAPLVPVEIETETWQWYALDELPKDPVDVVIVDGPPGHSARLARYPAYPLLRSCLSLEARFLIDDMGRKDEREMVRRWCAENPDDIRVQGLGPPNTAVLMDIRRAPVKSPEIRRGKRGDRPHVRVVFSKQADFDSDLFPLWLFWYQRVFRADRIILTPVRTQLSSIDLTTDFYSGQNRVEVFPIEMDEWDAHAVWRAQLKILDGVGVENPKFAISADSDQFFERPVNWSKTSRGVTYEEIRCVSDETPSLENVDALEVWCSQIHSRWGAFINGFRDPAIAAMGHARSSDLEDSGRLCFHWKARGAQAFLRKIASIRISSDAAPNTSVHWRRWRGILDTQGEEALVKVYQQEVRPFKQATLPANALHAFRTPILEKLDVDPPLVAAGRASQAV